MLYIRSEGEIGKIWVVKAIHMGFMFLEKQLELLLAILTDAMAANISGATVYNALSIKNWM